MPCNASYMDPTQFEINLSKVYGLLDELETGKLPENFGTGFDERVYNKAFVNKQLDEKTAELCSKLQKVDITQYSLEMQMWWRDHQKADKERLKEVMDKEKELSDRKKALKKLSEYEKKLLGL